MTQFEYNDLSAGNNNEQHDVLSVGEELEETMVSSLGLFPSEEVDTFIDSIGSRSNAGCVRKLPAWMCDKGTVHSEDGNSLLYSIQFTKFILS